MTTEVTIHEHIFRCDSGHLVCTVSNGKIDRNNRNVMCHNCIQAHEKIDVMLHHWRRENGRHEWAQV